MAIRHCRNTNQPQSKLPFQLFTPHLQYGLHSQFVNLDWMQVFWPEPFVYMHPVAAEKRDP
jgi:anaerobic selenocysteine-containing dehydrogenase